MNFKWNEQKRRRNIQNHRIDFADLSSVFDGPMVVWLDTREDYGEERWVGIGFLRKTLLLIVYTEPDEDTIRLISARKANKHERKIYQYKVRD